MQSTLMQLVGQVFQLLWVALRFALPLLRMMLSLGCLRALIMSDVGIAWGVCLALAGMGWLLVLFVLRVKRDLEEVERGLPPLPETPAQLREAAKELRLRAAQLEIQAEKLRLRCHG